MTTHNPEKPKEKVYHSNHFNSKSSHTMYRCHISELLNLHTTKKLTPVDKAYMCFQNDGKTYQATKCIKSMIMTKVFDYVLLIDTFEQQRAVLKGVLQSHCLNYHLKIIGINQSLSKNALFEHKCLQNIKKLYKHAGKWDNQQQFKDIIEDAMVSTPEGFIDNSTRSPMKTTPVKKPGAGKSLCLFTTILDVKNKTAICQVGAAKSKRKAKKSGTTPWALKPKREVKSKSTIVCFCFCCCC